MIGKAFALLFLSALAQPSVGLNLMSLYEGNGGSQNLICSLTWDASTISWNFQSGPCPNDEARSAVIKQAAADTEIIFYDSPSGATDDDFTVIKVIKEIALGNDQLIPTFEDNYQTEYVVVSYIHNNGLDGKVSRVEIYP